MIECKGIISLERPTEIVTTPNTVLVRKNIKPTIVFDDVFKVKKEVYMYDEIEYTKEEYNNMKLEERVSALEEEMKIVELAIAEFINSNQENPTVMAMVYAQYSAIAQMYANMIEKGIYTIDRVPERYRAEVEAVLEENKKASL